MSYSCLPNFQNKLSSLNKHKLAPQTPLPNAPKICTCTANSVCPVGGVCNKKDVIYSAKVTTNDKVETYTGVSKPDWKSIHSRHQQDMKNEREHATKLCGYLINLQRKSIPYDIEWQICSSSPSYRAGNSRCNLCVAEAAQIMWNKNLATLNSRSEMFNICIHTRGPKLSGVT